MADDTRRTADGGREGTPTRLARRRFSCRDDQPTCWMARKEPGGSGGTGPLSAHGETIRQVEMARNGAPNRQPSQGSTDEVRTSLSRVRTCLQPSSARLRAA